MSEFLIYKWDNDDGVMLVSHSKYWRAFNGHYGSGQNEQLLSNLKGWGYKFQTIPEQRRESVYEQFINTLASGPVTVKFNVYRGRVGHDFAVMTRESFERWTSEIQQAPVSPSAVQSPASSTNNDKSSWFSFFKFGATGDPVERIG